MTHINPTTIPLPAGLYSHGFVVPGGARLLAVSGEGGTDAAGALPEDFEAQAHNCWRNVLAVLEASGMTMANVFKTTIFLTDAADIAAFAKVRAQYLGDCRPASTLLVVQALARPEWKVEVEALAAASE